MNEYKKWQARLISREMVAVLGEKGYDAHYAEDLEEAKTMVLAMIPPGSSIALGGSETIAAMGLLEIFRRDDYRLFDRYQKLPHEEIVEIMRQSLLADFLVTGTPKKIKLRFGRVPSSSEGGPGFSRATVGRKRLIRRGERNGRFYYRLRRPGLRCAT